jgi:hypothetical protein
LSVFKILGGVGGRLNLPQIDAHSLTGTIAPKGECVCQRKNDRRLALNSSEKVRLLNRGDKEIAQLARE